MKKSAKALIILLLICIMLLTSVLTNVEKASSASKNFKEEEVK